MLKKTLMSAIAATAVATATSHAQQPAAPQSPHTFTGNVGLYSQYIFRGLKQTDGDPALQGGFDYSHSSGLYAGTWASNISWLRDNGSYRSGGSLEWDFYGGFKGTFGSSDFTYDIGLLYYYYPGTVATGFIKADTFEIYGALGWKWLSAKYSYSLDNKTFGVRDSSGTWYLDLSANVPLGQSGFTLVGHWGYQRFSGTDAVNNAGFAPFYGGTTPDNNEIFSYKDWKVGLTYALPKDFTIGVMYTKAYDANTGGYGTPGDTIPGFYPNKIAKGTGTIFLQKTF